MKLAKESIEVLVGFIIVDHSCATQMSRGVVKVCVYSGGKEREGGFLEKCTWLCEETRPGGLVFGWSAWLDFTYRPSHGCKTRRKQTLAHSGKDRGRKQRKRAGQCRISAQGAGGLRTRSPSRVTVRLDLELGCSPRRTTG